MSSRVKTIHSVDHGRVRVADATVLRLARNHSDLNLVVRDHYKTLTEKARKLATFYSKKGKLCKEDVYDMIDVSCARIIQKQGTEITLNVRQGVASYKHSNDHNMVLLLVKFLANSLISSAMKIINQEIKVGQLREGLKPIPYQDRKEGTSWILSWESLDDTAKNAYLDNKVLRTEKAVAGVAIRVDALFHTPGLFLEAAKRLNCHNAAAVANQQYGFCDKCLNSK